MATTAAASVTSPRAGSTPERAGPPPGSKGSPARGSSPTRSPVAACCWPRPWRSCAGSPEVRVPSPGRARGGRRLAAPSALPALLALALLVTGCAAGPSEPSAAPATSPSPAEAAAAEAAPGPPEPGPEPALPRGAQPEAVVIPAIGVSSPLVPLGLQPDERMEVPADYSLAG